MNVSNENMQAFQVASDALAKRRNLRRILAGLTILALSYGAIIIFIATIVIQAITRK